MSLSRFLPNIRSWRMKLKIIPFHQLCSQDSEWPAGRHCYKHQGEDYQGGDHCGVLLPDSWWNHWHFQHWAVVSITAVRPPCWPAGDHQGTVHHDDRCRWPHGGRPQTEAADHHCGPWPELQQPCRPGFWRSGQHVWPSIRGPGTVSQWFAPCVLCALFCA